MTLLEAILIGIVLFANDFFCINFDIHTTQTLSTLQYVKVQFKDYRLYSYVHYMYIESIPRSSNFQHPSILAYSLQNTNTNIITQIQVSTSATNCWVPTVEVGESNVSICSDSTALVSTN